MFSLLEDNKSNIKLSLARIGILSYVTVWLFVYCILYMRCAINCVHFWIFCVIFWLYSYHIFTIFTFNMHVQNLAVPHQKLICICILMTIRSTFINVNKVHLLYTKQLLISHKRQRKSLKVSLQQQQQQTLAYLFFTFQYPSHVHA